MVFVPSQKLRDLSHQRLEQKQAFKDLYQEEIQDPASWTPLEPVRTFGHYASTFAFGLKKDATQRLRVCEATETFRSLNPRYRQFDDKRKARQARDEERNTDKECFAYVRHLHKNDADSGEWRAAILEKNDGAAGGKYKADYLHFASRGEMRSGPDGSKVAVDDDRVLFRPNAKFLGTGLPEHMEYLAEAPRLKDQGMSDAEIAKKLNERIQAEHLKAEEKRKPEEKGRKPAVSPISVAEVQAYLRRHT